MISTQTPFTQFTEDISRSKQILMHALNLENNSADNQLFNDIRISAIALSVGAMDAYLCDKYSDCLACVLQAYVKGKLKTLPSDYSKEELPAGEVLSTARKIRPLWSIRIATRKIMEKDNVLSISRLAELFNGNLNTNKKIWTEFIMEICKRKIKRLTKYTHSELLSLNGNQLNEARRQAVSTLKKRISKIIQIRHDWIHNCARPKNVIQHYSHMNASYMIKDIEEFINQLDGFIQANRIA